MHDYLDSTTVNVLNFEGGFISQIFLWIQPRALDDRLPHLVQHQCQSWHCKYWTWHDVNIA